MKDYDTFFTDGNYGEAYPKKEDFCDDGIPFLRGNNLINGQISGDIVKISKEKNSELLSGQLKLDDIVISVRGKLGSLGYVSKKNVSWNINSQLAIIRTNKKILNVTFLLEYLISNNGQNRIDRLQTGTALKQLPIGQLSTLIIPGTNIYEQKKIGELLNKIDEIIDFNECNKKSDISKEMPDANAYIRLNLLNVS